MRNKKLAWNTMSGLLLQGTTVLCGFILPRAILNRFGSDVNGLINSIAQFLQMIAFLELGVGAVIQSALYGPLAEQDSAKISEVIASGSSFFRKLGGILVLYVVGVVVFCYCLLYFGFSIQAVKLTTAGIFLLRPILVRAYIRKNYQIDRKCRYTKDPIEQKWNGVAQHVAAIVLDSTDMVVLSVFSDMYAVSVYSVYLIVVSGIKSLLQSFFGGIGALFGELWAKQEREELNRYFAFSEWMVHGLSLFVWCCTYKLIVPFVLIYTEHMTDVDYNVPVFAALICIAYALYCLRLPFNSMILAAGHYKNTQNIYVVGAVMNLSLSILAVSRWGLIGVAVGTIAAMLYQVIHMGYYVLKKLKVHSFRESAKQYVFDVVTILLVLFATSWISGTELTWLGWIILAVKHAAVIAVCIAAANLVFYNKASMQILNKVMKKH